MSAPVRPAGAVEALRRTTRQRWSAGAHAAASIALAALLTVMVNYLAARHAARADWSRSRFYSLSDKTLGLLGRLSNEVDVVVFFQPDHPLYEDVVNLLQEYRHATPRVRFERVDPHRDLGRAEELARTYEVRELNSVVFANGGRSKVVRAVELAQVDPAAPPGEEDQRRLFNGEQVFSSALQSITEGAPPVACFLRGHGERDAEDRDPYTGYSELARRLRQDHADVRTFTLAEQQGIPTDASVVIVAGPTRAFSAQEVAALRAWMERNGRLMVLLDTGPTAGLETLLEEWGVRLGADVVVDPRRTLTGLDLFVDTYGTHPISRNLRGTTSVFYMPRSVEAAGVEADAADRSDQPQATPLAFSSPDSWAETDRDQKPAKYDKARDRLGPVSLAVAAERGAASGAGIEIRPTRLVVFGDTDFLSNGALSGGNLDLFLSAFNWLVEREQLLAIAPKSADEIRLVMSRGQVARLFWVVTVMLPGLAVILGAGVWLQRRQ